MRKLTVRRKKASTKKNKQIKIYIEDPNGKMDLLGTKCRLLGELENDGSLTCEIGEGSYKVYAFSTNLGIDIYSDYCTVPEGEEDVEIVGAFKRDFFLGSPFLFDSNMTEEKHDARKKLRRKTMAITIPIFLFSFAVGIGIVLMIYLL